MTLKPIVSTTLLAVLAACGGNSASEGSNVDSVEVSSPMAFAGLVTRAGELEDDYLDLVDAEDYTTAAEMPTSGRASMSGIVALSEDADSESMAVGQLDISVDFATDEVDGIASNFYTVEDEAEITGTLLLDADIASGGFAGSLAGDLTQHDLISVDIDVAGNFIGGEAQAIYGEGAGTFTGDGQIGDAYAVFAAD